MKKVNDIDNKVDNLRDLCIWGFNTLPQANHSWGDFWDKFPELTPLTQGGVIVIGVNQVLKGKLSPSE